MFYLTSKATRFLDPPHVCHLGIQSVLFSKTENEAQPEERMAQPESPLTALTPVFARAPRTQCWRALLNNAYFYISYYSLISKQRFAFSSTYCFSELQASK